MKDRSRMADMIDRYGEVCNRKTACEILCIGRTKLWHMINEGVIRSACAGNMIDVRSICEYIETPEEVKKARRKRKYKVTGMEIVV